MIGDATRFLHKISGPFDLIFQDSDKKLYEPMLDRLVDLLRPGGLLVCDNVLWDGEVIPGYVATPAKNPDDTAAIAAFNRRLAADHAPVHLDSPGRRRRLRFGETSVMTIAEWLAMAKADAEKRGLPELIPALEGLAQATERLRAADWNDDPDKETPKQ